MAGVTDKPFRQLCKRLGAGLAAFIARRVGLTADSEYFCTEKAENAVALGLLAVAGPCARVGQSADSSAGFSA